MWTNYFFKLSLLMNTPFAYACVFGNPSKMYPLFKQSVWESLHLKAAKSLSSGSLTTTAASSNTGAASPFLGFFFLASASKSVLAFSTISAFKASYSSLNLSPSSPSTLRYDSTTFLILMWGML